MELTVWDCSREKHPITRIQILNDQCKYFVCKEQKTGISDIMVMTKQKKLLMFSFLGNKFV